jgi:hypothetical protein
VSGEWSAPLTTHRLNAHLSLTGSVSEAMTFDNSWTFSTRNLLLFPVRRFLPAVFRLPYGRKGEKKPNCAWQTEQRPLSVCPGSHARTKRRRQIALRRRRGSLAKLLSKRSNSPTPFWAATVDEPEQLPCRVMFKLPMQLMPRHMICSNSNAQNGSGALELLVIASVLGIWCFENGGESVQKGVRWLRPTVQALKTSLNQAIADKRLSVLQGNWTPSYPFHRLNTEVECPPQWRMRNSA